jgi:dTDP-4-dehydrorhamnose 3,5-epimerase-like enzyme
MDFPDVGSVVNLHFHTYDHVTIVLRGAVHLRAYRTNENGEATGEPIEENLKSPAYIKIRKRMLHEFTALEADTHAVCIFALRDKDGIVTDVDSHDYDERCSF